MKAVLCLVQAYECLATLEGTSTLAQQALVGMKTLNRDELRNLSVYFDRVRTLTCCARTLLLLNPWAVPSRSHAFISFL